LITVALDRKKEDFRRGNEKVSEEILQTRYQYHHERREFKLREIYTLREKYRQVEA
jgi:hypothetical protein